MSNRPTPETDAARHDLTDYGPPVPCSWGDWVPCDITARLERERDEARAEVQRLRIQLNQLQQAASSVVERWEQPSWKDAEPTAGVIYQLRNTIEGITGEVEKWA